MFQYTASIKDHFSIKNAPLGQLNGAPTFVAKRSSVHVPEAAGQSQPGHTADAGFPKPEATRT